MTWGEVYLFAVAEILGHADIKMTIRNAHPTPDNKRKAVNVLAAVFSKATRIEDISISREDLTPSISTN